jgi:predicted nucleic acid-binding protein
MSHGSGATGSYGRLYVDTTVLAGLASADLVDVLPTVIDNPRTSYAVRHELEAGIEAGHEVLTRATRLLRDPLGPGADDPGIAVAGSLVRQRKPELLERLAGSEASVLYQALTANVPLATDDRDVRKVADSYGVPVTGSLGVVARAVEREELSVGTADRALETWRTEGYAVPVDSVAELLDGDG